MSADLNIILSEAQSFTDEALDAMGLSELRALVDVGIALAKIATAALERKTLTLKDGVAAADAAAQVALEAKWPTK